MLGTIFLNEAKKKYDLVDNLHNVEYKVFSQTGEDGIIDFLLSRINISTSKFVEIGVGDYSEANTRYVYEKSFSKGLIIDIERNLKHKVSKNINLWKGMLEIENTEIDKDNINAILDKYHLNGNLDLFSIDIDGLDYWVVKSLKPMISKIFVAEYNPTFGHNLEITIPYIKNKNASSTIEHEATTTKINEEQLFYCNQRGLNQEEAVSLIVNGFCKEVLQQLPMEFAVEAQKLVSISLEGSVG